MVGAPRIAFRLADPGLDEADVRNRRLYVLGRPGNTITEAATAAIASGNTDTFSLVVDARRQSDSGLGVLRTPPP